MEGVGLQILELLTVHIDNESVIAFLVVDKGCCQFSIYALKVDVVVGRNLGQCDVVFCLVGTESFYLLVEDTHWCGNGSIVELNVVNIEYVGVVAWLAAAARHWTGVDGDEDGGRVNIFGIIGSVVKRNGDWFPLVGSLECGCGIGYEILVGCALGSGLLEISFANEVGAYEGRIGVVASILEFIPQCDGCGASMEGVVEGVAIAVNILRWGIDKDIVLGACSLHGSYCHASGGDGAVGWDAKCHARLQFYGFLTFWISRNVIRDKCACACKWGQSCAALYAVPSVGLVGCACLVPVFEVRTIYLGNLIGEGYVYSQIRYLQTDGKLVAWY